MFAKRGLVPLFLESEERGDFIVYEKAVIVVAHAVCRIASSIFYRPIAVYGHIEL